MTSTNVVTYLPTFNTEHVYSYYYLLILPLPVGLCLPHVCLSFFRLSVRLQATSCES